MITGGYLKTSIALEEGRGEASNTSVGLRALKIQYGIPSTLFFRHSNQIYDEAIIIIIMKLVSIVCLSDRHEYCTHSFVGGTGCQCNCHPENRR